MRLEATLGELVKFVLKYRRGKAFLSYTEEHIAYNIYVAAQEGTIQYAKNSEGELCGIVIACKDDVSKILYIQDILTTETWVMKTFVKIFKERFGDCQLRAQRWYGRNRMNREFVQYKTERLCQLFLKKGEC